MRNLDENSQRGRNENKPKDNRLPPNFVAEVVEQKGKGQERDRYGGDRKEGRQQEGERKERPVSKMTDVFERGFTDMPETFRKISSPNCDNSLWRA